MAGAGSALRKLLLRTDGRGARQRAIDKVLGVSLLEFGIPETMWHLHVNNFMAIVTMDAHGNSLHAELERKTGERLAEIEVTSAH